MSSKRTKKSSKLFLRAKKLPDKPGVYLFKKGREVLYVGKAGSLKNRVRSYFSNKSEKVQNMLSEATNVAHTQTDSVLEALVLEAKLIKKYWPSYNVKEKDDRSFIYIVIPDFKIKEFPYPFLIRGHELEKYPSRLSDGQAGNFHVFGPYQSYTVAKKALELIRKIFPYCTKPKSGKPCFHCQISLCPGACIDKISARDYKNIIKGMMLFLKGEKKRLYGELARENPDKLRILKSIRDTALLSQSRTGEGRFRSRFRIEGYDISHFAGTGAYGSMVVFENNSPAKEKYRIFKIREAGGNDDVGAIKEVLKRRLRHPEWPYPDLILVDGGKGQVNAAQEVLKGNEVRIPIVGMAKGKSRKKDELVFGPMGKRLRQMVSDSKQILQKVRDEAHRFATKFSERKISRVNRKAN